MTQAMRDLAVKNNDIERMQAWAGQSAALASTDSAETVTGALWDGALALLK